MKNLYLFSDEELNKQSQITAYRKRLIARDIAKNKPFRQGFTAHKKAIIEKKIRDKGLSRLLNDPDS